MSEPFVGSEAIAAGMSWGELRREHRRLFRDVYVHRDAEITAAVRARGGWLWSGRRAVVAGRSAAAVHGSLWVDPNAPVELVHDNRHRIPGLQVRGDRIEHDEVGRVAGMAVTTPARTALDLACWHDRKAATAEIDALLRSTNMPVGVAVDLADRSPRRRGIISARHVLSIADAGAQSPRESHLRLLLIDDGLPPPQTQIPVLGDTGTVVAYLDMGWRDCMVAVEYDGEQHRTNRRQYSWDVRRLEIAQRRGWIVVRVLADDRPDEILRRVRAARSRRLAASGIPRPA